MSDQLSVSDERKMAAEYAEIPKRYKDFIFHGYSTKRPWRVAALAACEEWVASIISKRHTQSLLLWGGTGTGKTRLAVAALKEIITLHTQGYFFGVPRYLSRIQAAYDKRSPESADDILADGQEAAYVLLDDMGAEKMSDDAQDKLHLLLDERYKECRPSIITTNFGYPGDAEKGLQSRVGPRLISRLAEMCVVVKVDGPREEMTDWRRMSPEERKAP